jgi:hypothetical protein
MFSSYLLLLKMDKVDKASDSKCYTQSSEHYSVGDHVLPIITRFCKKNTNVVALNLAYVVVIWNYQNKMKLLNYSVNYIMLFRYYTAQSHINFVGISPNIPIEEIT